MYFTVHFCNLDGDQRDSSPEEEGWFGAASWVPTEIPFTGRQGPTAETEGLDGDSDPAAYFQLFLSDELLQYIVDETNKYAEQVISKVCVFLFLCIVHMVFFQIDDTVVIL